MSVFLTKRLPSAVRLQEKGLPVFFDCSTPAKEILILNLMSTAEQTEEDLLEKLALSDIDTHVTFLHTESWTYKRVPAGHYAEYYETFRHIRNRFFDGLLVTGSPVLPSPENAFWEEFRQIDSWARHHVKSQLHICYGAFASVMQRYHIDLVWYEEKFFGIFPTKILCREEPIFTGFEGEIMTFASREIGFDMGDIRLQEPNGLLVLAEYEGKGPAIMKERDSAVFYSLCHFDYNAFTLQNEYLRDLRKGIDIHVPENYYCGKAADGVIRRFPLRYNFLFIDNWLRFYAAAQMK